MHCNQIEGSMGYTLLPREYTYVCIRACTTYIYIYIYILILILVIGIKLEIYNTYVQSCMSCGIYLMR